MSTSHNARSTVTVELSARTQKTLDDVCNAKGITREKAVSLMVSSACLLLEECQLQKRPELLEELDFARGQRKETMRRADELLGLAERVLLETETIKAGLALRCMGKAT